MLCVIEPFPVQYHAPVYRSLQQRFGVPVTVVYGSDLSVHGYRDREFGTSVKWDVDLFGGHSHRFLRTVAEGGSASSENVSADGLRAVLRALDPRAVLVLGYSPAFYRRSCLEAIRLRRPLLFRGETTDHARRRSALKSAARDFALRLLYSRCHRLLYVGERSREHFRRLGCEEEKLGFSPYCVDTAPFRCGEEARGELRAATRAEFSLSVNHPVILFSGKLSHRKGVDALVRAAKILTRDAATVPALLFLGAGEMEEELRALAAAEPAVTCCFAGFQKQTQLSRFYHAADMLALPSIASETWGLVVNEALHHGVPVVASDAVGSVPDLVKAGLTGEVCAPGSDESLADALRRALAWSAEDPEGTRTRCRAQVAGYTVDKAAEGIANAYGELTGGRSRAPQSLRR